jgi:hypothetical protein
VPDDYHRALQRGGEMIQRDFGEHVAGADGPKVRRVAVYVVALEQFVSVRLADLRSCVPSASHRLAVYEQDALSRGIRDNSEALLLFCVVAPLLTEVLVEQMFGMGSVGEIEHPVE